MIDYYLGSPTLNTATPGPSIGISSHTPTASPSFTSGGTPTLTPPVGTGQTPNTVTPSTGSYNCIQGWTKPMSVSTPSITGDDLEGMGDLRKKYSFCDAANIVAVRCIGLISEKTAEEMDEKVTCDKTSGLVCNGNEQTDGKCEDYAVQVYCDCRISKLKIFITLDNLKV